MASEQISLSPLRTGGTKNRPYHVKLLTASPSIIQILSLLLDKLPLNNHPVRHKRAEYPFSGVQGVFTFKPLFFGHDGNKRLRCILIFLPRLLPNKGGVVLAPGQHEWAILNPDTSCCLQNQRFDSIRPCVSF